KDQVPDSVKSERLQEVQALIERQLAAFNATAIGRTFDVLFEKIGRHPGQIVGRSPYLQPVHITGEPDLIGTLARVKITGVTAYSLHGTPIEAESVKSEHDDSLAAAEA